ncbi:hypothetical protein [Pseudanabaena sp. FACHB-2040]|uniref:hypothetical protein n=1 Tax=Pseudanabaena sp. FACHB-2040 TaxID=2692859 RepID=UPI001F54E89B|nr:hypothetical protein [Pseudanabaena sp. FACHB-2040]
MEAASQPLQEVLVASSAEPRSEWAQRLSTGAEFALSLSGRGRRPRGGSSTTRGNNLPGSFEGNSSRGRAIETSISGGRTAPLTRARSGSASSPSVNQSVTNSRGIGSRNTQTSRPSKIAGKSEKFLTYAFRDKDTREIRYVGRTRGKGDLEQILERRLSSHHIYQGKGKFDGVGMKDHVDVEILAVQGNKNANHGAEDVWYEYHLREARQRVTGNYTRADGKAGTSVTEKLPPKQPLPIDYLIARRDGVMRALVNDPNSPPLTNKKSGKMKDFVARLGGTPPTLQQLRNYFGKGWQRIEAYTDDLKK